MSDDKPQSEAGFFCPAYVGVRCLLLLCVIEGHYWAEHFPDTRVGTLSLSVPWFFALSGFLISHTLFAYESLAPGKALSIFYVRRALRIFPAYFLVLAIAHLTRGVPYVGWDLTYLLNFKIYLLSSSNNLADFMTFLQYRDFNAIHFWSVCVEEQFYLVYPWLVFGTSRRWRTTLLSAAIVGSIACRLYLLRTSGGMACYGGLPFIAGEYILWGCLVAWMDYRNRWRWLRDPIILYVSLCVFFYLSWHDDSFRRWAQFRPPAHQTVYCVLIAVTIASLRHNNQSYLNLALAWKPLRWVGTMSYGAYLLHSFLNPTLDQLLETFPFLVLFPQCPRAVLGPVLTVGVASLLWYGFEKPIQGWRQRWRTRESIDDRGISDGELHDGDNLQQETEQNHPMKSSRREPVLSCAEQGEEDQHQAMLRDKKGVPERQDQGQ
ncbi:acyltransferase [bacterium]|nr:acyltransferase [bacterium]